jgi:hypothetical protein
MMRITPRLNAGLFFLSLSCSPFATARWFKALCGILLRTPAQTTLDVPIRSAVVREASFGTVEELFTAFTAGLVPDLHNQSQADAFFAYLTNQFGVNRSRNPHELDRARMLAILDKYPELVNKQKFNDVDVVALKREVLPVDEKMIALTTRVVRSAKEGAGQLFQVEANIGDWKKILDVRDLKGEAAVSFVREQLAPLNLAELKNPEVPIVLRAKNLFMRLHAIREGMKASGKNTKTIDQTLVNLISYAATLSNPDTAIALTEGNSIQRIAALNSIIQQRDAISFELGFQRHYDDVLRNYHSAGPTGSAKPNEIENFIFAYNIMATNRGFETGVRDVFRVRQMSPLEAPLRSCVGGSDCSSDTYFDRAFDPNYHYFTATSPNGVSSGHITVVLGENGMAFVDKIQNVPPERLDIMLTSVKRSVAEQGYKLVIPLSSEDQISGLSNDFATRLEIERKAKELLAAGGKVASFKARPDKYNFTRGYTRAYDKPKVVAYVEPAEHTAQYEVQPIVDPWKVEDLNFKEIVQSTLKLKDGSPEEKSKFVNLMALLERNSIRTIEENNALILKWLGEGDRYSLRFRSDLILAAFSRGISDHTIAEAIKDAPKNDRLQIYSRLQQLKISGSHIDLSLFLIRDNPSLISKAAVEIGIPGIMDFLDILARGAKKMDADDYRHGIQSSLIDYITQDVASRAADAFRSFSGNIEQFKFGFLWSDKFSPEEKAEFIRTLFLKDGKGATVGYFLERTGGGVYEPVKNILMRDQQLKEAWEAYEKARPKMGCFVAGTLVLDDKGVGRPIQTLRVGDRVLAYDLLAEETASDVIKKIIRRHHQKTLRLVLDDARSVEVTPEHPFYSVERAKFVRAFDLNLGEILLVEDGLSLREVKLEKRVYTGETRNVYNFETRHFHNYFSSGILVHNLKM